MSNYILILVWIAIAAIVTRLINVKQTETVCGERVERFNPVWAFIIFVPLIIWAGYRGNIGDTYFYMDSFKTMPEQFSGIEGYLAGVTKDKGFAFLSTLIKCIVGNNVEIYLLIIAFIQAFFLVKVYRKYSPQYLVSFFLFIASTDYISWMFNGIRQFIAATIVFGCIGLIIRKKYIPSILIILLASLIHKSALFVIPFIFIAQGRAWNKKTLLFIGGVVLAIAFVDQFTDVLNSLLGDTQYKNVVSDWQTWEDDGTNFLRVLVYSVPAILSLVGRRRIAAENNPCINLCTNMSIISAGIYFVSMFTSGIFIGRLPIYFSLYSYILLPWEIENLFTRKSARMVYIVMTAAYLVFYLYSISNLIS